MQQLSRELRAVDRDHKQLMQIFSALQQAPDELAASLLARIRLGETFSDIVESLQPTQPT
jgi:hypothetical protein